MSLRRKPTILGLTGIMAVLALTAVSAIGAASASAVLPEFLVLFECKEVALGAGLWLERVGGLCKKIDLPAAGNFEPTAGTGKAVEAGEKVAFTSTSGISILEEEGGMKATIECTADSNVGEINGAKTVNEVLVTFTGCKLLGTSPPAPCENTTISGEIVTKELDGELGYIKKPAPIEVGLVLLPEVGEVVATFECLTTVPVHIEVKNKVIGLITPINTPAGEFTLAFKQKGGTQEPTKFEGHVENEAFVLGSGKAAGEQTTDTIVMGEPVEIMA
jgi:hypothetical protein